MTVLVKCPNPNCRFRFPVNPEKHQNRRERFCPHCKTPIKVKGRLGKFLPNPNWQKQKEEQADTRRMMKEMRIREGERPPAIPISSLDILRASILLKQQIEEEAKATQKS
jgi:hypothetical protein